MMMYTGTSTEQDTRFSDKEKKLMKQMKFGDCLTQQVDMSKVKLDVLKPWITQKITEILKMEDDVVIDYVNNQLEEKVQVVEETRKKTALHRRPAAPRKLSFVAASARRRVFSQPARRRR